MNGALSSPRRQPPYQRRSVSDGATPRGARHRVGARFATVLGRIAAGLLLIFLGVSAVGSLRYGTVARQHALLIPASAASTFAPPVSTGLISPLRS